MPSTTLLAASYDPDSAAIENSLRTMDYAGFGQLVFATDKDAVILSLGSLSVREKTYDDALTRLAGVVLASSTFYQAILDAMIG